MQNNDSSHDNIKCKNLAKDISLEEFKLLFSGLRHDIATPLMVLTGIAYQINTTIKTANTNSDETVLNHLLNLSSRIEQSVDSIEASMEAFSKDINACFKFPNIDSSFFSSRQLYKVISKILEKYNGDRKNKITWNRDITFTFKCNMFWLSKVIMFILDSFFDSNPDKAKIWANEINREKKIFIELKNFNKNIKIYNLDFCKKIMDMFGGNFYIDQQAYITEIILTFLH